jgi:isovaleryl-CoA dehydrogenase
MRNPYVSTGADLELEELRETVAAFVRREVAPIADEIDRRAEWPDGMWRKLGELGVLGITIPERYGGMGLDYLANVIAVEEIARGSSSVGLSYGVHANLCANNILLHGTEAQCQRFLPRLCTGEWVGALAMSESGAGSDVVGSMACKAERRGDRWVANGTKMWITNGPDADVLIVYMRTAPPEAGSRSITAFVVEKTMKGFSVGSKLDKLGHRGSPTSELVFEDCEIPDENVLGQPNEGVRILMRGLDYERVVLAGGPIGLMQCALDLVLPYVRERKQFGQPIGTFELMQAKLADMYVALESSRAWVYRVAQACDEGRFTRRDAAGCLLYAAEQAIEVASQAIQCFGGNGYVNDFPLARLWRDARLYTIGAGTSEIRRMLIGRELFQEGA